MEVKEAGTMWRSEDDILRDIALLNDFSSSEEPHKILYSNGRGSKIKQKRKTDENVFLDPRTGEPIDASELESDDFLHESKGRGKHLGRFLVNKFQLLEQLRQARPLGSGDEAIESYCRRNIPKESPGPAPQNVETGVKNPVSNSEKPMLGIRGSRNSARQNNVLISNLLLKAKENSNAGLNSNKEQFSSGTDDEDSVNGSTFTRENNKHSIINGFTQNDEEEEQGGRRKGENKDGGVRHSTVANQQTNCYGKVINKFHKSTDLERESVTSDDSSASYSVCSDKDFPPLRLRYKK